MMLAPGRYAGGFTSSLMLGWSEAEDESDSMLTRELTDNCSC
jgi:hypothetical protein